LKAANRGRTSSVMMRRHWRADVMLDAADDDDDDDAPAAAAAAGCGIPTLMMCGWVMWASSSGSGTGNDWNDTSLVVPWTVSGGMTAPAAPLADEPTAPSSNGAGHSAVLATDAAAVPAMTASPAAVQPPPAAGAVAAVSTAAAAASVIAAAASAFAAVARRSRALASNPLGAPLPG